MSGKMKGGCGERKRYSFFNVYTCACVDVCVYAYMCIGKGRPEVARQRHIHF